VRREHADPRRGELDRQRQAVEPLADPGDVGRVVASDLEIRPYARARAANSRTAS